MQKLRRNSEEEEQQKKTQSKGSDASAIKPVPNQYTSKQLQELGWRQFL